MAALGIDISAATIGRRKMSGETRRRLIGTAFRDDGIDIVACGTSSEADFALADRLNVPFRGRQRVR
jgi:hypothetical protein